MNNDSFSRYYHMISSNDFSKISFGTSNSVFFSAKFFRFFSQKILLNILQAIFSRIFSCTQLRKKSEIFLAISPSRNAFQSSLIFFRNLNRGSSTCYSRHATTDLSRNPLNNSTGFVFKGFLEKFLNNFMRLFLIFHQGLSKVFLHIFFYEFFLKILF